MNTIDKIKIGLLSFIAVLTLVNTYHLVSKGNDVMIPKATTNSKAVKINKIQNTLQSALV